MRRNGFVSGEIITSGATETRRETWVAKGQNTAIKFAWRYAVNIFKIGTLRDNADEITGFKHPLRRCGASL